MIYKKPLILSILILGLVLITEIIGLLVNNGLIIGDENYFWIFTLIFFIFCIFNAKSINSSVSKVSNLIELKFNTNIAIIFGTILGIVHILLYVAGPYAFGKEFILFPALLDMPLIWLLGESNFILVAVLATAAYFIIGYAIIILIKYVNSLLKR